MNKIKTFSVLVAFTLLCSCAGVKFANAPINKALPETFTKRALYPAGVAGYEFQDLVGNILRIKRNEDPVRIGLIRPSDYNNNIIPITDPNNYYMSRIQKGAEAKGSYLAFAAEFTADQLAELELVDIARSGIAFDNDSTFQQILDKANTWVTQHPNNDTSITRLWIKSVVLTRRIYSDFTNVGAKASGQVGDVVGVSTGVYNKSEESIKSVIIAFEAFNIDELVKQSKATSDTLATFTKSFDKTRDMTIYSGTIKGKIQ